MNVFFFFQFPLNFFSYTDGFEDVDPTLGGGDDGPGNLRVPVQLLDVLLPLVNEEQLRGHLWLPCGRRRPGTASLWRLRVLDYKAKRSHPNPPSSFSLSQKQTGKSNYLLKGEIPHRDLVVRPSHRQDRLLGRVPRHRRHGGSVPLEVRRRHSPIHSDSETKKKQKKRNKNKNPTI